MNNGTTYPEATKTYPNGYTIYKPTQRGSGGAVRFNLNATKKAIFVEAANQNGERQFDWDSKVIMKWGLSDIGAFLALLQSRTNQAKLFHKTEAASSTCELLLRDDPERSPYTFKISRQEEADKSVRRVAIPLTHAEAALLETALRTATERIMGW
jgi:hypothetical protein